MMLLMLLHLQHGTTNASERKINALYRVACTKDFFYILEPQLLLLS